jgi:two-component system repressor protein LuxO
MPKSTVVADPITAPPRPAEPSAERRPAAHVLLVEDTAPLARIYTEYLRKTGCTVELVETGAAALASLDRRLPVLALIDLNLPDMSGMDLLRRIRNGQMPVGVIVITANGSISAAVEAMQIGAYDFIVKPFTAERLITTVSNALERARLERVVETLRDDLGRDRHSGFIGSSLSMQSVYRMIDSAAVSKATVFITGVSGTGKEVCAEAIHRGSPRRNKPFVPINCGAIPKDLIESEIFGHVKGAFTGAIADRDGAATRADGGTLFLDELCEMDLQLQTKLLRFIQSGTFQRVGGTKLEKVDIRIVCATNRDPQKEVEEGRFREDLYYRLHVILIHLPPLRERDDDVVEIARHYLAQYAAEEGKRFRQFDAEAEAALRHYRWPGNIRQVQNAIRNLVVMHDGDLVTADMLPPPVGDAGRKPRPPAPTSPAETPATSPTTESEPVGIKPLWLVEKETIERAIHLCNGNIPRAAALLEINPSTIYRKKLVWDSGSKAS